jgi:hypothetical protein
MRENFDSEPKPKDGKPGDQDAEKAKAEKGERSEAAKKLGKAGGEAAAKAKKAKDAQPEPEATADAKPDDADADEGKPGKSSRAKARIAQLARERAEERQKRQELEARLAKLETERKPKEDASKPEGDEEPQQDQFNTWEEYSRAVTRWEVRQGISEEVQKLTAKQREEQEEGRKLEAVKTKAQEFYGRLDEALQADPEFYNRVDPALVQGTPTFLLPEGQPPSAESDVMQAIVDSEHAAALLLHLSEHPDEMDKLRALPDTFSVFRAMGRLEARVGGEPAPKAEPKPEERPVSQAKPPVRPLTGSPQYSEEDVGDDTPFEDHLRIYNARDARARRGN